MWASSAGAEVEGALEVVGNELDELLAGESAGRSHRDPDPRGRGTLQRGLRQVSPQAWTDSRVRGYSRAAIAFTGFMRSARRVGSTVAANPSSRVDVEQRAEAHSGTAGTRSR